MRCGVARGTAATAIPASPSTEQRGASWWRAIPMRFAGIGIVAALAIFGAVTAASRDDSGTIVGAGTLHIADVRVGDCFDLNDGSDVEEVGDIRAIPCGEPHTFEAYFRTTLASGPYPSRTELDAKVEAACGPSFETYVGRDYETSELYVTWFEPTPEGWSQGDRGLLCVISTEDEASMTGSVRGSGR